MTQPFLGLEKSDDYATNDPTRKGWSGNGLRGGADVAEYRARDGIDGQRFASVGYGAWHELGVVADRQVSAEELLKMAGGMYEVYLLPSYAPIYNAAGEIEGWTEDPTRKQVARRNPETGVQEILGNRSSKYGLWQHTEMFLDFGDAIMDVAEPTVSTTGILYGGRQAFMCWKIPNEILVDGVDDSIQLWLLAHTSHDGSTPASLSVTPLRTVCGNTSRWNIRNALYRMTIRHTRNRTEKVAEARDSLKLIHTYADELEAETKALISTHMTTATFEQIVSDLYGPGEEPTEKKANQWDETLGKLLEFWGEDERQESGRNTAWAALNAVGQFADWELKFKTTNSLWTGTETGGKFWRSISANRDVDNKKMAMMRVVAEYAGV